MVPSTSPAKQISGGQREEGHGVVHHVQGEHHQTSREPLPADDQTALGAIPIELVRLLMDLLHVLPDLEHLGLEPTLTFLELLDSLVFLSLSFSLDSVWPF